MSEPLERMIDLYRTARLELIEARAERDQAYDEIDRLKQRLSALSNGTLLVIRTHPDEIPRYRYRTPVVHRNRRVPPGSICVCGKPCIRHHPVTAVPCCRSCYDRGRNRMPEMREQWKVQKRAIRARQKEAQS